MNDLAAVLLGVPGISGKFVDIRWARGDKIEKDSTQVIVRFYADPTNVFNPPSYIHYTDEYGSKVFLHLTVFGKTLKCMRCDEEGHGVSLCPLFFCRTCKHLCEKLNHICRPPKCLRCEEEGHNVSSCPYFYCHTCKKLCEKLNHKCFTKDNHKKTIATKKSIFSIDDSAESVPSTSEPPAPDPPAFEGSIRRISPEINKKVETNLNFEPYSGNKIYLRKYGSKSNHSPPTPPSQNQNRAHRILSSYGDAVKNKINFGYSASSPVFNKSTAFNPHFPPPLSPIKNNILDETSWPGLNTSNPSRVNKNDDACQKVNDLSRINETDKNISFNSNELSISSDSETNIETKVINNENLDETDYY